MKDQMTTRHSPLSRGWLPGFFLLGALLLTACEDATAPVFTLWQGVLSPIPPSRIAGQAAAATQFGRTEVSIEIRAAEPEAVYRWQVESGTCEGEGQIQGGPSAYPPLTPGETGLASSRIILSSLFKSGSLLAVKVYSTDQPQEVLVSCGALVEG